MPKGYKHLTLVIRCQISVLLKRGLSHRQIAESVGAHQTSISRDIKKNTIKGEYRFQQAHDSAVNRRCKASSVNRKMTKEVIALVREMLEKKQWSPEQMSGWLKKQKGVIISHESIYRFIWRDKKMGGFLYKNLRRSGKKYNKRANKLAGRGLIPNRVGIEERPKIVEQKKRVGDFEIDTIIGAKHKGAIVSVVERKTKLVRLHLIAQATAKQTSDAIIKMLAPIKKHVLTLTADNGKEFSKHGYIAKRLKACVYFARPYRSYERGLNENTNGLVRQYFPKKCNFTTLTQEEVKHVEHLLNTRPRKSLNFETPNQVFLRLTGMKRC